MKPQSSVTTSSNPKVEIHSSHRSAGTLATKLFELIKTPGEPRSVTRQLQRLAVAETSASGCQIVIKLAGRWQYQSGIGVGKVPSEFELIQELEEQLDKDYGAKAPVLKTLSCLPNQTVVLVPVYANGCPPEMLLLLFKGKGEAASSFTKLQTISDAMSICRERQYVGESAWQVSSLAAIVELVAKIESSDSQKSAANTIVNEIARSIGCETVALAVERKGNLKLDAVAGVHKLDASSKTYVAYLQTLQESMLRQRQAIYPAVEADNDHLLLAHRQLSAATRNDVIISQPLVSSDGRCVGAWLLGGGKVLKHSDQAMRFVQTATSPVADALLALQRSQRGPLVRHARWIAEKFSAFSWLMMTLGVLSIVLLMMMPVTYRVRCNCVLEPAYRRYAVAPFDGLVASGFAEPGDVVQTGDVLAEIDGRNIRWELSGVTAERLSSLRQREIELVDENIPELFLAELDNEKHLAEEAILNIKKDGLQIRSPIDGVVLSGSLERSEASSVKTGDVLFEVGSTEEMKIQIEIPADEVSQIGVGQAAKIWVEGNEDFPLETEISRIHPRSVIRDAKNVFIAEVKFENKDTRFRPGMKGVVRIDGYQRSLGWSLFHKPIDYIRSHFTWW